MDSQQSGKIFFLVTMGFPQQKANYVENTLGVDIKNKTGSSTAPTPQNTPINPAPITSTYRPSMNAISEDMETITTKGILC